MKAALLLTLPLLLFAACTTPAKHDTVVGLIAKCQIRVTTSIAGGGVTRAYQPFEGDPCSSNAATSVYVELTIRTPQGTTYTTSVPTNRVVNIGDPWPNVP